MKISTFIDYIQGGVSERIAREWKKGAAFEQVIQSELDDIVRTHIATKIGALDHSGHKLPIQQDGKSKVAIDPALIAPFRGPYDIPKVRENRFTYQEGGSPTAKTADLHVTNGRFVNKNGSIVYQDTTYWIELKVESPDTHLFGGKPLNDAWLDDLNKLQLQKDRDTAFPGDADINVKRHWLIMIAISNEMRGQLKSGFFNHPGDIREWNAPHGVSIAVGWTDLSRQGMVGVFQYKPS